MGQGRIYTDDEVDELVARYNESMDGDALSELIVAFQPYLMKWVNVLKRRHISTGDQEVGAFIGLFGVESVFEYLDKLKQLGYHTDDDLYHELVVIFIYTIMKYFNYGDPHFTGYLKNVFKYNVYRWVMGQLPGPYHIVQDHGNSNDELDCDILLDVNILPCLTGKEKTILYLRYIDNLSISEIARVYDCTSTNISIIIKKAKKKLSEYLSNKS